MDGLVREAALRALDDAELTFADIDAIVLGKAPDQLEGVIMPELSLCDALCAVGKPMHRVHTAGSVGGSTAISAATLIESGMYNTVLTVAYEKQSDGNFMWALSGGRSGGQGAGGSFAPWIRNYMKRSGAPGAHRLAGRGQGPSECAQEPSRSPPHEGHLHRGREGEPHALGSPPLLGVVPLLRRRVGHGDDERRGCEALTTTSCLGACSREAD